MGRIGEMKTEPDLIQRKLYSRRTHGSRRAPARRSSLLLQSSDVSNQSLARLRAQTLRITGHLAFAL